LKQWRLATWEKANVDRRRQVMDHGRITGRSHQKRLERPRKPAAIHFQCRLALMSGQSDRRCQRCVVSDAPESASEILRGEACFSGRYGPRWTQMDRWQRALRFHRKYGDATQRRLPRVRSMVKEGTDV